MIHNYTYTNQEISIEKMFLEFVIGRVLYDTSINRSTITLQDIHTVSQKDVYTQCVKPLSHHSLDTMRFALLSDNLSDLNVSDLVVQKIRNVCRYVYMQVVAS